MLDELDAVEAALPGRTAAGAGTTAGAIAIPAFPLLPVIPIPFVALVPVADCVGGGEYTCPGATPAGNCAGGGFRVIGGAGFGTCAGRYIGGGTPAGNN